jgi:hypothetical protein
MCVAGHCYASLFSFISFYGVFSFYNIEVPFLCVFQKNYCVFKKSFDSNSHFFFTYLLSTWPSLGCSYESNHRHRCQMKDGFHLCETVQF